MSFQSIKGSKLATYAGISLSLVCLFFVRGFRYLLYPNLNGYYEYASPSLEIIAIFLSIILVGTLFFLILLAIDLFVDIKVKRSLQVLFLIVGLTCFMPLNNEILNWLIEENNDRLNYELPLLTLGLSLVTAMRPALSFDRVLRRFKSIALVLLPVSFFFIFKSLVTLSGLVPSDLSPQKIAKTNIRSNLAKRVVWLIFDEFEYAATKNRPKQFQMPVFEKLASQSFEAENAMPPNYWTIDSLPSLLSGHLVSKIEPVSTRDIKLTFRNDETSGTLGDGRNIFAQVKNLEGSTGVLGWVHPYPRLFENSLDIGDWQGTQVVRCDAVIECIFELTGDAFQNLPVRNPFESYRRLNSEGRLNENRFNEGQLKRAPYMREEALKLTSDERLDFVFIHFSIPHARFLDRNLDVAPHGYFQALEAVDETLGLIRKEMESKGLWDSTTLIVSGDHWWRFKTNEYLSYLPEKTRDDVLQDQRVPFLVKLAGQKEHYNYREQFNTVVTHNVVLGLLSGEIVTSQDVANRISKLRSERPLEVNYIPKREVPTDSVFKRNSGGFVADPSWVPSD